MKDKKGFRTPKEATNKQLADSMEAYVENYGLSGGPIDNILEAVNRLRPKGRTKQYRGSARLWRHIASFIDDNHDRFWVMKRFDKERRQWMYQVWVDQDWVDSED